MMPKTVPATTLNESSSNQVGNLIERSGLTISEISERLNYCPSTVYRWRRGETEPNSLVVRELERLARAGNALSIGSSSFSFIDLFAGIGGMRMAFEDVGGRCVFTSEWNKYSRKTYEANFACDHPIAGDIRDVQPDEIPAHDVLLAGFPCQPFSLAGVSKKNSLGRAHGFECKTQGTLFFDITRILAFHRPAAFVLENVKNLQSHDRGETFTVILDTLKHELEYKVVEYGVVDAKGYVPQHRERIFIIGFRTDTPFSFRDIAFRNPDSGPVLRSILHPEDGSEEEEPRYTRGPEARVLEKYTLSDKLWNYLQEYAEKHRRRGNGFGYSTVGPDDTARTLSARYHKDGSEILVRQKGRNPRRLTPRECSRLMGFDRPGRPFEIPVSDTQAYQQFGNAVVVPVVREIATHILPRILSVKQTADPWQMSLDFNAYSTAAVHG